MMKTRLEDQIRSEIEARGAISFAEFMELALYGQGGFYESPPIGESGHFITSPHVHPVFGRLVAGALESFWERLERPAPFKVLEAGAGDGTLASLILDASPLPIEYTTVERSAGAREEIGRRGIRATTELEPADAIVANELLDNLPFHRVRARSEGLVEVGVGVVAGRLAEVEIPCRDEVAAQTPPLAPGEEVAVSLEALGFVDNLANVMRNGYALLIDYGSATGESRDTHGYRKQRLVEEVLADPGSTDITAGVDFRALADRAREWKLQVFGPVRQSEALVKLGFAEWSRGERDLQAGLLQDGSGMAAVKAWGGRNEANLLVDPAGLGGLLWIVLATPGLPSPEWLQPQPDNPGADT
ncbi:MAG: SAM-dependent methyltransferase [Actinomycetota bacterium]